MALTPSKMIDLGTDAPEFNMIDTDGNTVSLGDFSDSKALVVAFICNHCPYVKHIRMGLVKLAEDYMDKGVSFVAINSNDPDYDSDDSYEMMKEEVQSVGYQFPYLLDETQEVAKAYKATCTPDFFVYDSDRKLVYRGQMDNSRPGNMVPVTGKDLRDALEALLSDKEVNSEQKPSTGCNIKWKPGNQPDY